jgi:hypothetical protein
LPLVRTYEIAIVALSAIVVFVEPLVVTRLQKTGIASWWKVPFPLRGAAYALCSLLLLIFGGPRRSSSISDFPGNIRPSR